MSGDWEIPTQSDLLEQFSKRISESPSTAVWWIGRSAGDASKYIERSELILFATPTPGIARGAHDPPSAFGKFFTRNAIGD